MRLETGASKIVCYEQELVNIINNHIIHTMKRWRMSLKFGGEWALIWWRISRLWWRILVAKKTRGEWAGIRPYMATPRNTDKCIVYVSLSEINCGVYKIFCALQPSYMMFSPSKYSDSVTEDWRCTTKFTSIEELYVFITKREAGHLCQLCHKTI